MKKISVIVLSAAVIFTACHNSGSSTVAEYESSTSTEATEHNKGHEEKEEMKAETTHDSADAHSATDTTKHEMPAESHNTENKKETEQH